MPHWG